MIEFTFTVWSSVSFFVIIFLGKSALNFNLSILWMQQTIERANYTREKFINFSSNKIFTLSKLQSSILKHHLDSQNREALILKSQEIHVLAASASIFGFERIFLLLITFDSAPKAPPS